MGSLGTNKQIVVFPKLYTIAYRSILYTSVYYTDVSEEPTVVLPAEIIVK
jgi:hypothetical protein